MARQLSLGLCCSLLWLGVGCGETSSSATDETSAGASWAGAAPAAAGTASAGAPTDDCQQVTFEDAVVERAVRMKLSVSDQQPLDGARLSVVDGINLEGATSLAGLECCTALTSFQLSRGALTDASALAKLPKLRRITFYQTQLGPRVLSSLSGAPALRELYFNDIPIDDLSDIEQLPALTMLGVSNGQVSDIGPLANTKLESLMLGGNPLADIQPLASLTTLHYLSLDQTKITSVEALAQLSLQELGLDDTLVPSLAALKGPLQPEQCSHLWVRQVPLTDDSWATDRERLCALGWAVRASRPGDADDVTCGHWCDIQ